MDTGLPNWREWIVNDRYFDDLAVFSVGPLHPGGLAASRGLLEMTDWRERSVLDLGCGNGTTLRMLQELGARGVGIEASPYMRQAALRIGLSPESILAGDISNLECLGLLDQPFDCVIAEGVLGFVPDPCSILECTTRVIAPGGWLYVCDWVPHQRSWIGAASYGFRIYGRTDPQTLADVLSRRGYECTVYQFPTTVQKFRLTEPEALRRASCFFGDVDPRHLKTAVHRKVELMRSILSEEIRCERFVLVAATSQ